MKKENTTPEAEQHHSSSSSLDDEQRIKVLSPSMLVFKRFMRNRLAIAGSVIIIAMFLFSFLGALISPYGQKQIFESDQEMSKDYASASFSTDYRFAVFDDQTLPSEAKSQMLIAIKDGKQTYEAGGATYFLNKEGENFYTISAFSAASVLFRTSRQGSSACLTRSSSRRSGLPGNLSAPATRIAASTEPTASNMERIIISPRLDSERCSPGMSAKMNWSSPRVSMPVILLRVVCGLGETMATFSPTRALSRVDLPTLGRPIIEIIPHLVILFKPR